MKDIIKAMKRGWQSGGVKWRDEFLLKELNPDIFLKLPGSDNLLRQYLLLSDQGRVIFLNTLYRRYPFLRNNN